MNRISTAKFIQSQNFNKSSLLIFNARKNKTISNFQKHIRSIEMPKILFPKLQSPNDKSYKNNSKSLLRNQSFLERRKTIKDPNEVTICKAEMLKNQSIKLIYMEK